MKSADKWGDMRDGGEIVKNLSMFDVKINSLRFKIIILNFKYMW